MKRIKHTLAITLALLMLLSITQLYAIADEGNQTNGDYEEWQTESDDYSEDGVTIRIILEGLESVEIRIADSESWENISDGSSITAIRSNSIEIKGKEGYWLSAAYGETENEAKNSLAATVSESEGGTTSVGVDNDGFVYIKAAASQSAAVGDTAVGTEDADGNVTWNTVSNTQADAGSGKSTSVYKKGQKFYGKATAISRVPRDGGSTITFRHDNGWIKNETKVKTITAVCISGHTRGLSYVGAVFNYVATIKEVSGNRIKVQVIYYPRKNKPNTWYGSMAPKAQIMARTLWISQYPHTGYVSLRKTPGNSSTDFLGECPNNYSLTNAQYYIFTDSACTSRAKDTDGNDVVLTTDERGNTNVVEIDLGGSSRTFWAKEVLASKGYRNDPSVTSVTVTTENTQNNPAVIQSSEPPSMGIPDLKVYKLDPSGRYGWNKLRGAEYRISYYDVNSKDAINTSEPKRSWTFKTRKIEGNTAKDGYYAGFNWKEDDVLAGSDDFYLENGIRIIPCGWFTIQETKAPSGLALDDTVIYGRVYQSANGQAAIVEVEGGDDASSSIEVVVKDSPQAVRLIVEKADSSTGNSIARETEEKHSSTRLARFASLAGAEYEVYYDDNDLSSPELVGKIITDEYGHGELSVRTLGDERFIGDKLTVGNYLIKETKASAGFVTDDYILYKNTQKVRDDEEIEVICSYDQNGDPVTKPIKGTYQNGGHLFRTRAESLDTNVFSYTVSSAEEPIRTYIKKTDAATGAEVPGATLQVISDNEEDRGIVVEQWVSTEKEHLIWELPEGNYILREINAPYGYDIAEDISFEIKSGVIINRVEMKNKPLEIGTDAKNKESATHHGNASDSEAITDNVRISGLYAGRTYKVTGYLVDKTTGEKLKDRDGNAVFAEKEFTAETETVETELSFTVDTSTFTKDSSAVGFEKLYRTSAVHDVEQSDGQTGGSLLVELAKHEDLNCESQTIRYGGIVSTMALDEKGRTKEIKAGKHAVIKDYVEYKGLSTEEVYTLEAEVYDKTASMSTGIKAETDFKPFKDNGTMIVEIKFDAGKLEGHDLVVFETLYLNGKVIDVHADSNDRNQTIHIASRMGPETGASKVLMGWIGVMTAASIVLALMVLKRLS